jgi:NAD-reducing hydrogenase large subunit
MDSDPAHRNVAGLLEKHPDALRDGIALRKFGQQVIERLAGERIHPSWTVPGGVSAPLDPRAREMILADLPGAKDIVRRTLALWKGTLDRFPDEIESFGNQPTLYAGLVGRDGALRLYDGVLRFFGPTGEVVADAVPPADYARHVAEASVADSYLKAPYYRSLGYPEGIYRVGPLARLNVADRCGTPEADSELTEYRDRLGRIVQSAFHYHYARLIETTYALERIEQILGDPGILSTRVRATAGVNATEGVGVIEAPRGILIHHYKVDENGAMVWVNLVVATGHNNLAIGQGVEQVARRFVDGQKLQEGALNRVSALVRAYDPCLSCSTHAAGTVPIVLRLVAADGELLDEMADR